MNILKVSFVRLRKKQGNKQNKLLLIVSNHNIAVKFKA